MKNRAIVLASVVLLLGGCSSGAKPLDLLSHQSGVSASSALTPDQAKSWAAKWCQVKPGMDRDQIKAIMGPPTQSFDLASGTPSMSWYAYEYGFTAFMNADDVARQLDVNDSQLTDAEKTQIQCDFTRVLH